MSTRVFIERRYRIGAVVVAMALAVAVFVLAVRVTSIWSATSGPRIAPAGRHEVPAWPDASGVLSTVSDPGGNVRRIRFRSLSPHHRPTPRRHPRPKYGS
jgi:hypothetical protein